MNFYDLPSTLDEEILQYEAWVKAYLTGSLSPEKMKSLRVPIGVYEQRDREKYMLRVRLPGGAITPDQLLELAQVSQRYTEWPLHFTTRQDVQVHALNLADTVDMMKELRKIGLSSRGGGGNTVRNITGAFDTGVDPEELFSISPYVKALTTRMIAEKDSWSLPRKFKIAFSGSSLNRGLATVADLGFIAKRDAKGQKGFSVYLAGGMGLSPKTGFLFSPFVSHDQVYNITKAAKGLYDKYGNRRDRNAARFRFLLATLGQQEFLKRFEEELHEVWKKNYPPLDLESEKAVRKGFLEIPLFLGDIPLPKAKTLGVIMSDYGGDCLRVTPTQNIFLRDLPEGEIPGLRKRLIREGILEALPVLLNRATVCAGAGTCKLGICLSRGLMSAIREEFFKNPPVPARVSDLSLKISGCLNSCAQHLIADIGFYGAAKRQNGYLVPFYHFVAGGSVEEGRTRFAERVASIPAKIVPSFLREFLGFVDETRKENEPFIQYLNRMGRTIILKLEEKYGGVPGIHEDRSFYCDWGFSGLFSLDDRSEGECAGGAFDTAESSGPPVPPGSEI